MTKYCPLIQDYLAECFTSCGGLLRDKCAYDPLLAKEVADLKAMREASKIQRKAKGDLWRK